jgi:hypothetical protein
MKRKSKKSTKTIQTGNLIAAESSCRRCGGYLRTVQVADDANVFD